MQRDFPYNLTVFSQCRLELSTVPRAAWHQGVVSYTVSLGDQAASQSTEVLPLYAGLCRGGPNTFLANREYQNGEIKLK